jgi:hypothetical protein
VISLGSPVRLNAVLLTVTDAPFCPQLLEGLEAALHGALLALLDLRAGVALVEHLEVDIGEGMAHVCLV